VTRFDDPEVVGQQYASEAGLRARQAVWENVEGENAPVLLRRVLAALRPTKVLEVGGGQGELAEWMQQDLGADVTFVDQSERMVELARARGIANAQVANVHDLPFDDEGFDTAVAAWMLYHVQDLDRGLAEIARVLEPGGRLVAVTNSVRHLEEFGDLFGDVMPGFDRLFNAENGVTSLLRHFSSVERIDTELVAIVDDRAKLVAYRDSLPYDTQPVPEDVPLPFRVHGRTAIFTATK
jgi:SAM-dependent methyltransferase